MSVITLSATLPSEFVSTATVGTSADWLVIQKSGENYLRKIPASASAFGAANLAGYVYQDFSAANLYMPPQASILCDGGTRGIIMETAQTTAYCLHFKVYAPGIGFSPLTASNISCTTLTCSAAGAILLPTTASIWCSGNQRGIQFNNSDTTVYGNEFKAWNASAGAWAAITAASLYCATGGIKVNGHITADDRATYDLGSPAEAFNELYLAADSSSMGRYNHTALYTSADAFKIRTASGSGSSWSFSDTYKPVYASAFTVSSSRRLKADIAALTGGRARLRATAPSAFRLIADGPDGRLQLGFIAEELEAAIPEAVVATGDEVAKGEPPSKGVTLMPLIATNTQAIIELDEAMEALTRALQKERAARLALEARIAALE